MLQTMRNHSQGLIAKIIVFFIIVVFALWGVESIVSLSSGEQPLVDVDGIEIYEGELKNATQRQKDNLKQRLGNSFNENMFSQKMLRDAALEQLINQKVSQKLAENLGLVADEVTIDKTILSIPAFQKDGKFDAEQFRYLLGAQNMTPMSFRAALAQDIKVAQVNQLLAINDFSTEAQADIWIKLLNEQRDIQYKLIDSNSFKQKVSISDEQINDYYKANEKSFMSAAKIRINYVQVELDKIASQQSVSDDELASAYAEYKQQRIQEAQRASHHILIEINTKVNEAQALKKAQELRQQLKEGADFAQLAQQHSDDPGSKQAGGNLGFASAGSYAPEFEQALNSLKVGEISAPIKTEFGYHIIRLDEIKQPDIKSFASQKERLSAELKKGKAELVYSEKIQELTNASFSAGNIDEVAQSMGLKVQESDFFTLHQGQGIASHAKVRTQAFSDKVLLDHELSAVIELKKRVLVLAVKQHQDAKLKPLADVKNSIIQALTQQLAQDMAQAQAEKLVTENVSTKGWKSATLSYKDNPSIDNSIKIKAFQTKLNQLTQVKTEQGYALFKVTQTHQPAVTDKEKAQQTNIVQQQRLQELLISLQNWAKNTMSIKRRPQS